MDMFMIKAMIFMRSLKSRFLEDERGDVNVVSIVVLIGVAVLLAIVFKDAIGTLLSNLFQTITTNSNDAITTAPATGP